MSALFKIEIKEIRVTTFGPLTNIIKQIDFVVIGSQEDQTFELSQTLTLPDPEINSFIRFEQITEHIVKQWIIDNFKNMHSVEAHIQYVLDKNTLKAKLSPITPPWTQNQ